MGHGEFDDLLFDFDVFSVIVHVVSVWILWFYFFTSSSGNGFLTLTWNFSCNIGHNISSDANVPTLPATALWGSSKRHHEGTQVLHGGPVSRADLLQCGSQ